ncbi:MAG: metal-dependent hydrolase [Methylobacter sp.]
MSPTGHIVTAFAMAESYMQISDTPWEQGFSSLSKVISSGNLANVDHSAFATLVALGMLLGARGPDRLEIPSLNKRTKVRRSVIPHRTLTHWPPLWVIMTAACWSLLDETQDILLYTVASVGIGFCAASWLHLIMDIMTPSGIPLLLPFGSRTSLNLYKTAQPGRIFTGEWLCILSFVIICQFLPELIGLGGLRYF